MRQPWEGRNRGPHIAAMGEDAQGFFCDRCGRYECTQETCTRPTLYPDVCWGIVVQTLEDSLVGRASTRFTYNSDTRAQALAKLRSYLEDYWRADRLHYRGRLVDW